jgi:conjugal transfer pilus assembly protein TraI
MRPRGAKIKAPSATTPIMRSVDRLLGSIGLQRASAPSAAPVDPPSAPVNGAAAYPSVDPGIPALAIDEVLCAHKDLIDRIKICYGMDRPTFEGDLMSLIRSYAAFVHLLPATPDNYFNAPGGLLRMGLEVAFFSLQGTDGHIFSGRSTITTRRHLEPRWRHATFIAGLCSEIHRTLCHVIVTDEHGDEWQPYLFPLSDWLASRHASRFYLKWLPNVHESRTLGVFALPHVVPGDILQHLADGNSVIVPHMMASISGMPVYRERNILDDLVRHSVAIVVDRYLQASADRYGKPQLGSHLERYLVDALRRLVSSNSDWNPNVEKSRVWYASDGLFIAWPNAAAEIRSLLEGDALPGIPKAPETMLEILIAAGVLEPHDSGQATWQIVLPHLKNPIEAVKLSSPEILFAGIDPAPKPLGTALVRTAANEGAAARPGSTTAPDTGPASANRKSRPGQQLPLPIESIGARAQESTGADQSCTASPESARPRFSLNAPMRLNPAVQGALAKIVDTLNREDGVAAACAMASGLFVPLAEFKRRRIDPSHALRSLTEVGMLVRVRATTDTQMPTEVHDIGRGKELGLIVHPRFIAGLDPANFGPAKSGGD